MGPELVIFLAIMVWAGPPISAAIITGMGAAVAFVMWLAGRAVAFLVSRLA